MTILEKPWHVEFRDAAGRLLTRTQHTSDYAATLVPALPFSFVRRSSDFSRSVAAVFSLAPGEKLFGCGESFTRLDKRGQKVVLWTNDANGVQTERMYKPIPFFLSSRGYGMFVHTSAPATFDIGASYHGSNALLLGDDELDLFVFLGTPKQVLDEYTTLTGKAAMPPLWSFGFWMSRITYISEDEVRTVAAKLRENRVPADVIHLDTGWFETDWRCDYQFSKTRFRDPAKMIADLKRDGFHISLWQLPYFVPKNTLFPEIVEKGLAVRDAKGNLPYEDAVLDFSNPATVSWYQEKIASLLRLGVGAIKVDFGEAAPLSGVYASGRTGFYEHNLYPLRYNRAVAEVTRQVTGESIIWARSAWAGSQRYPLHWGGDAGNLDNAMLSTLRGGLSFGLSGFSFWSHDIGGFTAKTPEELYRRWLPFGMLTSHSRAHGDAAQGAVGVRAVLHRRLPPRGGDEVPPDAVRLRAGEGLRASAACRCCARSSSSTRTTRARGWSRTSTSSARTCWWRRSSRPGRPGAHVYLPPGVWIDYQTGRAYAGGWQRIEAGEIPAVILVRDGAVIPHAAVAQSTAQIDWTKLELVTYLAKAPKARGLVCLPSDNRLREVAVDAGGRFLPSGDLFAGKVTWTVRRGDTVKPSGAASAR